jgi:hypothetical protein
LDINSFYFVFVVAAEITENIIVYIDENAKQTNCDTLCTEGSLKGNLAPMCLFMSDAS